MSNWVVSETMGKSKLFNRAFSAVLMVTVAASVVMAAVAVALVPAKAQAAVAVDTHASASLELSLVPDGAPAASATFSIYRVADVSFTGELSPVSAFASYGLSFQDVTAEGWAAMAARLAEAVANNRHAPDAVAVTDTRGVVRFADLPVGLYLVMGDPLQVDGASIVPAPFMVCLPDLSEADEWIYDVQASVKHQIVPNGSSNMPESPDEPGQSGKDKLPQTGQLWWPVPVLLCAGLVSITLGAIRLRR